MNRLRQRGLSTVGLILWALMAAAVLASIYGAYRFVVNVGVKEEQKRLAPLIAKCDAENGTPESCAFSWSTAVSQRAQAVEANKTLKASIDGPGGLKEQAAACSAATQAASDAGKAAVAEKMKALDRASASLDALRSDRKAQLAKPTQGGTCEQKMARITASQNEVAVRELRDRPPTVKEAADMLGVPTGAPDPRRDRVRVQ